MIPVLLAATLALPAHPASVDTVEIDPERAFTMALEAAPVLAASLRRVDAARARLEGAGRGLPGDEVEGGAPLVFLHSHELTDALRDLASAEARLAYADAAVRRSSLLLEAGAIGREEVERREADRRAIAAEVARATEWIAHLNPDEVGSRVKAPRRDTARAEPAELPEPA